MVNTPSSSAAAEEDGYGKWPIKELKRFLGERGVDASNIVEKMDLVAQVRKVAAQGPEGAPAQEFSAPGGREGTGVQGYVFDPHSGYFSNPETGMYYDASSGAYYQAASGKWFRKEGDSFVEFHN
eukprot:gene9845-7732_t